MPAYHGPAQVIVSARSFEVEAFATFNHAHLVSLSRNGPAHYARLEFAEPLRGPERANYVQVRLPNGLAFGGSLLEGESDGDGPGWLMFQVEEGDWGLLG